MKSKVWIDLDNSPHVPFFAPIIRELERRGHTVLLTSRDCFQVCELADYFKLDHRPVGRHYGANKIAKVAGTLWRSLQLAPFILKHRPDLTLSHGSRPLVIASSLFRIPSILMFDYEHAKILPFFKADLGLAPITIDKPGLAANFKRGLRHFNGLKEDVYVASYVPGPSIRESLGVAASEILVTIRPPAVEAHYHNPESDKLFSRVVEFVGGLPNTRMIILPRNEKTQRDYIRNTWPEWCASGKIIVPEQVMNGLDLIWQSDLVISGGGTMNREAAALGVPVYSIFRGTLGAVDKYLAEAGRLTLITTPAEVDQKIRVEKRAVSAEGPPKGAALEEIMDVIETFVQAT